MDRLADKLNKIPAQPGVYIFKDDKNAVLYVGKAKNLRSRVRSYFSETDNRFLIPFLKARIKDLEFIVTDTEKEALLLENNLIKKYQPRYNLRLRDDKTYFHLKLTTSEKFPRLLLTRRPDKSRDMVFGPFASSKKVKETISLLLKLFPLRRCESRRFILRERPCLNYEIGKCPGPCAGKISENDYQSLVESVIKFLRGQGKEVLQDLTAQMKTASEKMEFEKAARLRDQIQAIQYTLEKQKVEVNLPLDRDALGYYREADRAVIFRLGYRNGVLILGHPYFLRGIKLDDPETLGSFLKQLYLSQNFIPREILVPFQIEDQDLLQEWLSEQAKHKVEIMVPERGDKAGQVQLANANAKQALLTSREKEKIKQDALMELKQTLRLEKIPHWIECFDISNLGEKLAVGAMVKFLDGEPDKTGYRRYRIKGVDEQNDYQMMKEVLSRRFKRALEEKQELPDLIILDGGKGQLNIALKVAQELGIKHLEIVSLAKEREIGEPMSAELKKKPERIFLPGVKDPIRIKSEPALHLLQRIRDEAHRFALTYHKKLRQKALSQSALMDIPGIGEKKKRALLKHFGSLKQIRNATLEELKSTPGISSKDAERVFNFFRTQAKSI